VCPSGAAGPRLGAANQALGPPVLHDHRLASDSESLAPIWRRGCRASCRAAKDTRMRIGFEGKDCARASPASVARTQGEDAFHPAPQRSAATQPPGAHPSNLVERFDLDDRAPWLLRSRACRGSSNRPYRRGGCWSGAAACIPCTPALDVEARHAVGQHRPGPRLAVAAGPPRRRARSTAVGTFHSVMRSVLGSNCDRRCPDIRRTTTGPLIDAAAPRAGVRVGVG